MPLPSLHSYWVEPGALLAGEYPGARSTDEAERKLTSLLDVGVRLFVDLTEADELPAYAPLLEQLAAQRQIQVDYRRHAIRDLDVPRDAETMSRILDQLAWARRNGVVAYIHCWGGIGRTGTVVGCREVERGYDGERALQRIEELRWGSSKAHRASPETPEQCDFVRAWPATRPTADHGDG